MSSGAPKAVKLLTRPDDSAARRLRREAELLRSLDHPRIVPFTSLHEYDGGLALVTDWVQGATLAELNSAGATRTDPLALLHDLAEPLDYMHAQGIVHRDLSPSNIIVQPDGVPVLVDLGIGHAVGASTLTNHDLVAGTPKYLAPEIIRGEPATGRSDQYSLAIMLYELTAQRSPFPRSDELATALHHQLNTEPQPLDELLATTSVAFSDAVTRALSKDPDDRFPSVAAFARAAHAPSTQSAEHHGRFNRSNLVVAAAAVFVAVAAWLAWPSGSSPSNDEVADIAITPAPIITAAASAAEVEPPTPAPTATAATDEVAAVPEPTLALAEPNVTTNWLAGTAETLSCNQLEGTVFENGSVPLDYFGNPPGREQVVASGGYGDSWALEIGIANDFGQYGEIVPISAGNSYLFRGWFTRVGQVEASELGISLLDANYQPLDITVAADMPRDSGAFVEVRLDAVPDLAAFAIPYLFKDASPGVVLADELIFGETTSCAAAISSAMNGS